ncbi:hypothetical protein BS78_02G005000 [Paspalum vaginatum]|nr:hypothetical protein BS78_02G005000 [Paspalum vaginatum]
MPPLFIGGTAGGAIIVYGAHRGGGGGGSVFQWWLPVVMLAGTYQAVVYLAMDHLILFSPEAPFAAWEALVKVGYKRVGAVVAFTASFSLFLVDHPWVLIAWPCLLLALMAAVVAFWLCIARTYGGRGKKAKLLRQQNM